MKTFLTESEEEILNLFVLKDNVENSFLELAKYLGEDVEFKYSDQFFTIITDFIDKFEVRFLLI